MGEELKNPGLQQIDLKGFHNDDSNITIAFNDRAIEVTDHVHSVSRVIPSPSKKSLTINTGEGKDIIHIISKGPLSRPYKVCLDKRGGQKLIVGTNNPKLQLRVCHTDGEDIVMPDNRLETYEAYVNRIRRWNECSRKADGLWKLIRRRIIYLFGRDLKFRRPFTLENKIRKLLNPFKAGCPENDMQGSVYFTTREHLDQLESVARPGDILLRYQEGYPLDKYFVGIWQHAGLFLKRGSVIDAMGNGTYLRTLDEFGEADGIMLVRIDPLTEEQIHLLLSYAFEQVGKSYCVDFDDNTVEQYCSGLIVNAYKFGGALDHSYSKGTSIHPDDLLKLPGAKILWTNRPDILKQAFRKLKSDTLMGSFQLPKEASLPHS